MFLENKILRENIETFRLLLNEAVDEKSIVDAIQKHEYLYIYYAGDEKNKMGYRTIRPYVLGTSKAGNLVLRAWQDNAKNSYHFEKRPTRKDSLNHDYWIDEKGMKPGWRLFRLDRISKVYPTGKKFHDENGLVMIPSGYHEGGDDDMINIIAYVSTKKEPDFEYKYDKGFYDKNIPKTDVLKQKWNSIRRGNKYKKKITANDVIKLSNIASNVYKKNKNKFLIAIDDKNDFHLINVEDKEKHEIPDIAIVGNLSDLFNSLVKKEGGVKNKKFFDNALNNAQTQLKTIKENIIPTIPYKIKTFFK